MKQQRTSLENAVSEAIGYIIVFGIVMSGIGLVTMYGYPALMKQQQNAEIASMQRAFISLQSDINSLTYKHIPYKEANIHILGGTLSVVKPQTGATGQTIRIEYIQPPNSIQDALSFQKYSNSYFFYPGEIRFTSDDQQYTVALENGGINSVWWSSPGSVMLSKPRWFVDYNPISHERTIVITLIQIDSSTDRAISGGISNIQMQVNPLNIQATQSSRLYNVNKGTVKITYSPNNDYPYSRAWYNLFSKLSEGDSAAAGNYNINPFVNDSTPVIITISNVDYLYIKGYEITILNI